MGLITRDATPIWSDPLLIHQMKIRSSITKQVKNHKGVDDNALRVLVLASMEHVAIPLPHNAGLSPLPWTSLAFHPLGLFDLRRKLGKPSLDPNLSKFF